MNGHVVYGQALFDAGRYDEAQVTFTTALGLDPENLIALRHLGDISRLTNNAPQAIEWYNRVLEADPRNDEILAFIDELKASAPPPPQPAPPAPPREPTPVASPVVAEAPRTPAAPQGADRASQAATPVMPVDSVPAKRPSVPLVDVELDFGDTAPVPPPVATPSEPAVPMATDAPTPGVADLEFGNIEFPDAGATPAHDEPAPVGIEFTDLGSPAEEAPTVPPTAPAPGDLTLDSGLGWDMPGDIALDGEPADESTEPPTTPEVFVTETMAELYLQQGFRDEALSVYRKLAEQNPDDASIRERIASLEGGGRSSLTLERVSEEIPVVAPGTDHLVPMNDAAPPAADEFAVEPLALDTGFDAVPAAPPAGVEPEVLDLEPAAGLTADVAVDVGAGPVAETVAEPPAEPAAEPAAEPVAEPAAELPVAMPAARTARSYFAGLAQRRAVRSNGAAPVTNGSVAPPPPQPSARNSGSLDALFGGAEPESADEAMGRALATAVGSGEVAPIRGRPTQPAGSELSLDAVFRGDAVMRTSGPIARQSSHLKFDQFFAVEDSGGAPAAPPDPGAAPADDAQFQNWLQGLKDK